MENLRSLDILLGVNQFVENQIRIVRKIIQKSVIKFHSRILSFRIIKTQLIIIHKIFEHKSTHVLIYPPTEILRFARRIAKSTHSRPTFSVIYHTIAELHSSLSALPPSSPLNSICFPIRPLMDCVERVARTWTYDESRVGSSAICTEIDASARRERERQRERVALKRKLNGRLGI